MVIGATTTNSDAAADPEVRRRFPALSQAVLAGASGQLRNMATVYGNLLQRTRCAYFTDSSQPCNKRVPGSGCAPIAGEHHNHAVLGWSRHCVATHPSGMAVALAAYDAVVHYETLGGAGEISLSEFYLPVGDTPQRETTLLPAALITAVTLPKAAAFPRSRHRKVRERASCAFATVSVAAALDVHNGRIRDVRIALGGVASRPWRALAAEEVLRDGPATAEQFLAAADAALAAAGAVARQRVQGDARTQHHHGRPDRTRRGGRAMTQQTTDAVGVARPRIEGRAKVTGSARRARGGQLGQVGQRLEFG